MGVIIGLLLLAGLGFNLDLPAHELRPALLEITETEVGLPQHEIPLALLMLNVGVETGQILFLTAVLLFIVGIKRLPLNWRQGSGRLMPYSIGGIAAFWTIDRVVSFL